MRSTNIAALGAIEYPNALHFVYDTALINLPSLPEGVTGVAVQILGPNGETYTEQREIYGEGVTFDISRYLQMLFAGRDFTSGISNNEEITQPSPTFIGGVSIGLGIANDGPWDGALVWNDSLDIVWGGLRLGEVGLGSAPRRWWKGYPMMLDYNITAGQRVNATSAGQQVGSIITQNTGLQLVDLSRSFPDISGRVNVTTPQGITAQNDNRGVGNVTYSLEVVNNCSVDFERQRYLRWVDNQGRFCYWLFDVLSEVSEVTSAMWLGGELYRSNAYTYGVNDNSRVRKSLTQGRTVQLVARNLPEVYWPLLLSLCTSPLVQVFDGYEEWHSVAGDTTDALWHRVEVADGSYTKLTRQHIEDFSVIIVEPTFNTQQL